MRQVVKTEGVPFDKDRLCNYENRTKKIKEEKKIDLFLFLNLVKGNRKKEVFVLFVSIWS